MNKRVFITHGWDGYPEEGWFPWLKKELDLTGLEDDPEVRKTAAHWLGTPINLEKVKSRLPKSVAIFSDNDPYVLLDNQDDFRNKLNSKIIIEHGKGHFSGSSNGITELPIVLESILNLLN